MFTMEKSIKSEVIPMILNIFSFLLRKYGGIDDDQTSTANVLNNIMSDFNISAHSAKEQTRDDMKMISIVLTLLVQRKIYYIYLHNMNNPFLLFGFGFCFVFSPKIREGEFNVQGSP